jgi:hypothetical protein
MIALLLSLFSAGCGKTRPDTVSYINATIDGRPSPFSGAGASYRKGSNYITINTSLVNGEMIQMHAYLPPSGLGTIFFSANGSNTAMLVEKNNRREPYYIVHPELYSFSDENRPGLEGQLTITKLDIPNRQVSGTFAFKTYNRKKQLEHIITEGRFTDVMLMVNDDSNRPTTNMTCTASPSNEWFTNNVYSYKVKPVGSGPVVTIYARTSINLYDQGERSLYFSIPVNAGTGTFEAKAGDPQLLDVNVHVAHYNYYFKDYAYQPVPGAATITVHSIDDVTNTLSMSFNLEMKNKDGTTLTFANGQLEAKWLE